jgi:hypothetical protein
MTNLLEVDPVAVDEIPRKILIDIVAIGRSVG